MNIIGSYFELAASDVSLFTLLVSLYAAIVTTILARLKIIEFNKHEKNIVQLTSYIDFPYDKINVKIVNFSHLEIIPDHFNVRIGFDSNIKYNTVLLSGDIKENIKLKYAEKEEFSISRNMIHDAIKNIENIQRYHQRLFVEILMTTNQKVISPVYIDTNIIDFNSLNFEYNDKSLKYLATDTFLGFNLKKPKTYSLSKAMYRKRII
jgi:hypothetical protein